VILTALAFGSGFGASFDSHPYPTNTRALVVTVIAILERQPNRRIE
jgi:hypothetical protein